MNWAEDATEVLTNKLGSRAFTAGEAAKTLERTRGLKPGSAYRLLHDLVRAGALLRFGRGLYRFVEGSDSEELHTLSVPNRTLVTEIGPADTKASAALGRLGVEFRITGPSLLGPFIHHFPRRMIHLVYVSDGAGDSSTESLKESGLTALKDPTRGEVRLALAEFSDADLFIVREKAHPEGEEAKFADLEGALVDTYFESTRKRIPYPAEEVGRIFANVLEGPHASPSHILMHAGRRGIKRELRAVMDACRPDLRIAGPRTSDARVRPVLSGIAAEAR